MRVEALASALRGRPRRRRRNGRPRRGVDLPESMALKYLNERSISSPAPGGRQVEPTLTSEPQVKPAPVDYQTDPSRYRHWRLAVDGAIATITMDVQEDGGIRPGYKLKLNSYDLGVDIELHDL